MRAYMLTSQQLLRSLVDVLRVRDSWTLTVPWDSKAVSFTYFYAPSLLGHARQTEKDGMLSWEQILTPFPPKVPRDPVLASPPATSLSQNSEDPAEAMERLLLLLFPVSSLGGHLPPHSLFSQTQVKPGGLKT